MLITLPHKHTIIHEYEAHDTAHLTGVTGRRLLQLAHSTQDVFIL